MHEFIPIAQWQAFIAVVENNGYAQAAEAMGKSQSAVSYAIQQLESRLGLRVFNIQGRKAVPSKSGEILLQRARQLLAQAQAIESAARQLAAGREPLLRLAIDALFPEWLLLQILDTFSQNDKSTRIEILETVLSGTDEALLKREIDLAITPRIPQGFSGDALMQIRFIAVAAPDHPLHHLGKNIDWADLRQYRQLVLSDSGSAGENFGWLDANQRWTFSHLYTSIKAACAGLGFAWYPELRIKDELATGELKPLPMKEGLYRYISLYRVFARPEYPGIACQELADIFTRAVTNYKSASL